MPPPVKRKLKKDQNVRDLFIVGDFIRYFLWLAIPFVIIGGIYGIFYKCFFMCLVVNPIIYAGGITAIIIVIKHDVNDILALIGRAREPNLAMHIKHASTIQQISVLMSSRDYDGALKAVTRLLKDAPKYPNAISLKGQILLEGYRKYDEARQCFEQVMTLSKPDSEDYKLAEALRASTFPDE